MQQGPRIVEGCQAAVPPRAWYALTGGTSVMAVPAAAKARRASSCHLSKPAPRAHGPPPTRPKQRQGPPAASPPPYQPSMSAHIQQMPRYRRHRESQPNPETETVRAYPRVHIRPRPRSPRTPTAQNYEESPRPATATSPLDPIIPTHAHSSAQGHGPAQGQWWRRWTHMQLWERRKWARQSPPSRAWSTGPPRGRWRTAASSRWGGGCHRPHGKPCWPMRSTPWESTPETSLCPRTTRTASGACSRRSNEKADACRTSP